jgi:hypothetical protein
MEDRNLNEVCGQCGNLIGTKPRVLAWRLVGVCSDQCNKALATGKALSIGLPDADGSHLLVSGLTEKPIACTNMGALVRLIPKWARHQASDSTLISRNGSVTRYGITVRRMDLYRAKRK